MPKMCGRIAEARAALTQIATIGFGRMNIIDAIADERLFALWFQRGDWTAWRAFLATLFALPVTDEQREIYQRCTGRGELPQAPFGEAWLVCGRRGGKSFVMALVGTFLATFKDYREYLQPGERATVAIIAADRKQARNLIRYVKGLVANVPMLQNMVQREVAEGFEFNNGSSIEITTCSSRATRGYTFAAVLADEVAFWDTGDYASDPDREILAAVRPGMATIPGAMLLCASSPYARKGELWQAYRRYYADDEAPVLVWQADTRTMNPSVPQTVIDAAYERDAESAKAEYGAQFRSDLASFVSRTTVEACVVPGRFELPYTSGFTYRAFTDPSGGARDSFTLCIGHLEGRTVVVDVLRETKAPFSPEAVTKDYADVLTAYHLRQVTGDRYAGEWPRERFATHKITYEPSPMNRSELYANTLPLLTGKAIELPDSPTLINQLCALERRTRSGGRDSIDHPPGQHDDASNAVAGLAAILSTQRRNSYTLALMAAGTLDDNPKRKHA